MHLNGKIVKISGEEKKLKEMGNCTEDLCFEIILDPRDWSAPTPGQYVCITIIFKDLLL